MTQTAKKTAPESDFIRIRGASQNNLKHIDVDIPVGEFTVVTGLSGSGKSSLVFDTLYAEGQRRYVETFSPYARQFLDRMDRPHVDAIEGVPPAIAIDQNGVIRTSRSTVGTMTELNDHLKLLFAHHAQAYCPDDGSFVPDFTPETIWEDILERLEKSSAPGIDLDARLAIAFELAVPKSLPLETAEAGLSAQGFTRILKRVPDKSATMLAVAADRFRPSRVERGRALEAIETALEKGAGKLVVYVESADEPLEVARYRRGRVCPSCGKVFASATPNLFSFNSPVGACPTCRGFGRVIENDIRLIIPDPSKTLEEDAVKPFSTAAYAECKEEMLERCAKASIRLNVPFEDLSEDEKRFVVEGDPAWSGDWRREWYGIKRFFEWLETKSYKMHVRVMLSRYRSYVKCPDCGGSHLKSDSLVWRYGTCEMRAAFKGSVASFKPVGAKISDADYEKLPGFNFHELMLLPIKSLKGFFGLAAERAESADEKMLLSEINSRLGYLVDVGLGYLTLDRQGRTLSGGEVQRVNLTTALGTNLVNTLFVLDEPSIGLHPRDMDRVNGILRRLTEAGNTLVVVEHDPQVMLAANRLIDMGPKAGREGGEIIFEGPTRDVLAAETATGAYLSGRKRIERKHLPVDADTPKMRLMRASKHNLKIIAVDIPLGRFVAVAGVSGSGKSTLVADTLVPLLSRALNLTKGPALDTAGALLGGELPSDCVFVDQSPLGRTTRGNPASYVGAFDGIRRFFGMKPQTRAAGFKEADFSFNAGKGRCPHCLGAGYEHVEMQFLSDVYLPCPVCKGRHYRDEILALAYPMADGVTRNIADTLELTVKQALDAFEGIEEITGPLSFLDFVGLGYLTLGQPLTTLSGGERQRLKLAAHIAEGIPRSRGRRGKAFIFDEPTTGLHFADVARLIEVFDRLIALGHTVIVIEHNLDVVNCADWVIELGPEGGDEGGKLVFAGTPEAMIEKDTLTGAALQGWRLALAGDESKETFFNLPKPKPKTRSMQSLLLERRAIVVEGAREHNLKDITTALPRGRFNVITGPSGSGKSTLAFDIIFAEGQRRYLESLNAYARSMVQPPPVPEVDAVRGIAPTVAIEQRTSRGGMRSTVATLTEIYHFLRLIYVKLGTQYCPDCGIPVEAQSAEAIADALARDFGKKSIMLLVPVVQRRKGAFADKLEEMRTTFGRKWARIDGKWTPLEGLEKHNLRKLHDIEMPVEVVPARASVSSRIEAVKRALSVLERGQIFATVDFPEEDAALVERDSPEETVRFYSALRACPKCARSFPELDSRLFSYNATVGACPTCLGYGVVSAAVAKEARKKRTDEERILAMTSDRLPDEDEALETCPDCGGTRLNEIARNVLWKGESISRIGAMTIKEASAYFKKLRLSARDSQIARDAVAEIVSRLAFLEDVGLAYLSLDRSAPTLSGGESQRIRLAAQLGTNLRGVCYVLDEPTIGLHPRDNGILLSAIERLTNKGNTLLVVEHDEETIRRADHVLDIGPGAGIRGGRIMAEGTVEDVMNAPESPTGAALKSPLAHTGRAKRPFDESSKRLVIEHADENNLSIDRLEIPIGRLTVITGVSGSGKSTLAREVLFENVSRNLKVSPEARHFRGCASITGLEAIGRILEVDQTPIGKTPRSCPATYVGFFDKIRALYAQTPEAVARGFAPGRFSFNNAEGSCPVCGGQGLRTIEMNFLPDVKVLCEACRGSRFNAETLAVAWKGKNIGEVLQMEVDEAAEFFASMPAIAHPLRLMQEVGLGYLTLGQPSPTLSGGEAQRIKLVSELAKVRPDATRTRSPHTLYVLDEPTVGLHMTDVEKLTNVLSRLVDAGNTVVVIEHNLDVIAEADWVIDLGPEGGAGGGRVVAVGEPATVAKCRTETGRALKAFLKIHRPKKRAAAL